MNLGFKILRSGFNLIKRRENHRLAQKFFFSPGVHQIRNKTDKFVRQIATTKKNEQKYRKAKYEEDTDSDSDTDDDEKHYSKERGESEFWKTKMRTLHRILDVNKDGVVSFDDFKLLTERFTDLGHLTPEHHDEFQEKIREAWELQRGTVDPYNVVTTEQFLEDMHHILNDKDLRKKIHSFLPFFFKAVDQDHDGEITIDEYKIFFQCLGLSEADAICSFRSIDVNNDGKLSVKEFVDLGREYLLSEDSRTPSKFFWGPLVDDHFHKS
ncbi:Sarcoplasmic calcium-binding protein, putative [Pediculus humanus corporis]|uniref:Sarcoplasmic calcium-binding protein, putative n=1 Tax=Pediculus humanus subsp. corporis TaxID=121224 RepID=E0W3P5_PEDHC|nr:Sarcoplasmic calcium-binding protein, putative [Pediculus humanus corporis]EEB20251.1 Sarcoplasmic calcium-binding protein, putative [Pediculus humanus corporis]